LRLNPFVYVSETTIRFYLLVAIGIFVPSMWASVFILTVIGPDIALLQKLGTLATVIVLNTLLVYGIYRRYPSKILKETKPKELDRNKFPDHVGCIEKLCELNLPSQKWPILLYQPFEASESAFTLGKKGGSYIVISGGLIMKFRKNVNAFTSIILHEMGHIANKDIKKTYLAAATSKSLFLTLQIALLVLMLPMIYIWINLFASGTAAGFELSYIASRTHIVQEGLWFAQFAIYFIVFLGFVYLLRNQIFRLREFYADAKVVEWEKTCENILEAAEESGEKKYSPFQLLSKFHPNVDDRIQVIKNNSALFTPNIWVALTIGFLYSVVESNLSVLKTLISTWGNFQSELNVEFRAFVSVFLFTALMVAVSSSFHRSVMKDVFDKNARFFSRGTAFMVAKFSLAFSFGFLAENMIGYVTSAPSIFDTEYFLSLPIVWALFAIHFSLALIILTVFGSKLIRQSFSRRKAERSFFVITILSSALFICDRFVAIETFHNYYLIAVFFTIFSFLSYAFVAANNRKLTCPNCNNKLLPMNKELNCPHCNKSLFSWAVYEPPVT
jgi:Zn-dependent protease with chaperone function